MGRIVMTEFVSLDGVIEAPGGGEGFKYDGWIFEIDRGDEGNAFKLEETMATEALLLGRKTYEGFAEAWPRRDGEFADKFNTMPKYVVSSTLDDPEWTNTTVLDGDLCRSVADAQGAPRGRRRRPRQRALAQALIEQDLVDELRLMVFPVVLGDGKRLFGPTSDKKRLRLADPRRSATASRSSCTSGRRAGRRRRRPAGAAGRTAHAGCRLPPLVTCQTGRWPT